MLRSGVTVNAPATQIHTIMIKVFVMQTCPDCTQVKEQAKNDPRFEVIDIGEHVRNLKQFLTLRDSHPAFDKVKQHGSIGIPCFVMEDGSITFSPEDIDLSPVQEGEACSIDGKGC